MRFWSNNPKHGLLAFTLLEVLIALTLLGVIATFAIPKVLQATGDSEFKGIGKETAALLAGAFSVYRQNNGLDATTTPANLTQYINYVSIDTASLIDSVPTATSLSCASFGCLKLHNGSTLLYPSTAFGGTTSLHAIWFHIDPDGVYSGNTTGPGKGLEIMIYYDGTMRTYGTLKVGTMLGATPYTANPVYDPNWFSWN